MKKRLQGFMAGLLAGIMLFAGTTVLAANYQTYQASTANFPIYINGDEWKTDSPVVVINGRTYLPLRALGDALSVEVDWNEELFRVEISKPEEIYVVTAQGNKYHRRNCTTVKMVKEYLTKEKAEELGYKPCGMCQPGLK